LGKPEAAKPDEKAKEGVKVVESIIRNLADGRKVEITKTTEVNN